LKDGLEKWEMACRSLHLPRPQAAGFGVRLFDEIKRDDTSPASYSEPKFAYLNRSGRPAFHAIRAVLELWFSQYPHPHCKDLRGRFRSTVDTNHRAAFFELFLHELLLRLGQKVVIHPSVCGTTKEPDFLVTSGNGESFYLECVVAGGQSREEAAKSAVKNAIHATLNRLHSPNFFIEWEVVRTGEAVPSARKIGTFLVEKLALHDPDEVGAAIKREGFNYRPRWLWSDKGWALEFSIIPKSPTLRGKPGVRPMGIEIEGGGWVDDRTPLRDAILKKAGKYGKLNLPFVVAVNSLADHLGKIDILDALFGKEAFVYTQTPEGVVGPKARRVPDGVWTSPRGTRYTRLSAVLLIHALFPWNIPRCSPCLYLNPFAERRLDCELNRLPRMIPKGDQPDWVAGDTLSSILGLPRDWPGEK
jgi:hypothetical protein